MAGRIYTAISEDGITASDDGTVTVNSTSAYREGMMGYLMIDGQDGLTIRIAEIVDDTIMRLSPITDPRGGLEDLHNFAPNYGGADYSDYNGGRLSIPEQFVYNPNDEPLT